MAAAGPHPPRPNLFSSNPLLEFKFRLFVANAIVGVAAVILMTPGVVYQAWHGEEQVEVGCWFFPSLVGRHRYCKAFPLLSTLGLTRSRAEGGDGEDAVVRGFHEGGVERRVDASPHVVDALLHDKGLQRASSGSNELS